MGAGVAVETRSWRRLMVANLAPLTVLLAAAIGNRTFPDRYFLALQEDRFAEWLTFWSFMVAGVCFGVAALRCWRYQSRSVWFLIGLSCFCLFVAGEEVSWGQRLLGFGSPEYFLAENFQQEVNVHNVLPTGFRKWGLKVLILGFGVVLPSMVLIGPVQSRLERWGVLLPPWELIPSYLAMFLLYQIYPWKFSGEVVELMLGLVILLASLSMGTRTGTVGTLPAMASVRRLALTLSLITLLGVTSAAAAGRWFPEDPMKIEAARLETDALRADLLQMARQEGELAAGKCGLHKRLFSFVEKYRKQQLQEGSFASIVREPSSSDRARYFIDPWNTPYWIRHSCGEGPGGSEVLVYSFGPNRMRDSGSGGIRGDDVGAVLVSSTH